MPPNKRPADEDAGGPAHKKAAVQQPTPTPSKRSTPIFVDISDEREPQTHALPDNGFRISVGLNPSFDVFPKTLRDRLVNEAKQSLYTQALKIKTNTLPTIGAPHSIIEARGCKGSRNAFVTISSMEHSADVSFANKELLLLALRKFKRILSSAHFVELDPPKDRDLISNPSFVHWHSVRHGEIGWGFDKHGCLSLYSTKWVGSTVQEDVLYVKKAEYAVKIEA
ncbi:hypothetical protein NX059_007514 [Plenodomus lindquistii]|nr:hypothetical protein NX059_007514 [Plenodomus lindquistii]